MRFRQDGPMDFPTVFMLLEPRYFLHFLQSATPSQAYVAWSEYVVWWVAELTNGSQWLISLLLLPVWANPLLWALALIQPGPEVISLTKPAGNYLVLIVLYSGCISPFIGSCGWIRSRRGQRGSGTGARWSARRVRPRGKDRPASFWPPRAIGLVYPILCSFILVHFIMAPTQRKETGLEGSLSNPLQLFSSLIPNPLFRCGFPVFCCMHLCCCFFVLLFVVSFLYHLL